MIRKKLDIDLKQHWNETYARVQVEKLGWYEDMPEPSLRLIDLCQFNKKALLLNVGTGATRLVDELLDAGYEHVIANDLSVTALDKLKLRLGERASKVRWIVDDLIQPTELCTIEPVDLWHDRAVLHFFSDQKEQDTYFNLLRKLVKKTGFVIIATFNLDSASKCSGLPIFRYDKKMLQKKLGEDFELIKAFDYCYTMPKGETRKYVYTLFKRIN